MLWSLIKISLFVTLVGATALGVNYLTGVDRTIQVIVSDIEYTISPMVAAAIFLALICTLWLALQTVSLVAVVLRFISGDETAISRFFNRGRERRGFRALTDALVALASGDGRMAAAKAARAEQFLQRPALADLVTAQAAELACDTEKASEAYKRLIKNENTRFVGVRGMLRQRLAEGSQETARLLAEHAFALRPRHKETQDILLLLQIRAGDWSGARKTLSAKFSSGHLPQGVYTRRSAILALAEATHARENANTEAWHDAAIKANRLSPGLIPAAVMAARAFIARDRPRVAQRIIRKAWGAQPHPDLAAAFAEIAPNEDPVARLKRFRALTRIHPKHCETRKLLAELNIVAEDFPEARRALSDLPKTYPDARVLTLMAAVERGEGAPDRVVRGWLAKAVTAQHDSRWTCENCRHVHSDWVPVCENCEGFDTLSWILPQASAPATMAGADMLPLLVADRMTDPGTVREKEDVDIMESHVDERNPQQGRDDI